MAPSKQPDTLGHKMTLTQNEIDLDKVTVELAAQLTRLVAALQTNSGVNYKTGIYTPLWDDYRSLISLQTHLKERVASNIPGKRALREFKVWEYAGFNPKNKMSTTQFDLASAELERIAEEDAGAVARAP